MSSLSEDFFALCIDRTAVERVYYNHRLGEKLPFEKASPPSLIEQLVRVDQRKERALRKVYGVEITRALLEAEVQRINSTTRAPEILSELKDALGNDSARFAQAVAKPIVVERLLRQRFSNDDKLHTAQRREAESTRAQLTNAVAPLRSKANTAPSHVRAPELATEQRLLPSAARNDLVVKRLGLLKQRHSNYVSEITWQLGARPKEKTNLKNANQMEIRKRFGPNAKILSSPHYAKEQELYFAELPDGLQRVLRVQLRQAGDVSAVIETPGGFLVYLATQRTAETLSVAMLSLPKLNYEQWLAERADDR